MEKKNDKIPSGLQATAHWKLVQCLNQSSVQKHDFGQFCGTSIFNLVNWLSGVFLGQILQIWHLNVYISELPLADTGHSTLNFILKEVHFQILVPSISKGFHGKSVIFQSLITLIDVNTTMDL